MKLKASKREIEGAKHIYNCGYCGLQTLLSCAGVGAHAYNSGIYGWNWDAYEFNGVTIIDGYRSFPRETIARNPELQKEYEEKARQLRAERNTSYEEYSKACVTLLTEFTEKIKAGA